LILKIVRLRLFGSELSFRIGLLGQALPLLAVEHFSRGFQPLSHFFIGFLIGWILRIAPCGRGIFDLGRNHFSLCLNLVASHSSVFEALRGPAQQRCFGLDTIRQDLHLSCCCRGNLKVLPQLPDLSDEHLNHSRIR